jgi:opacity protein-like surface antigen
MRKFLISLAVATSALAVAAPASAQYFPQPQGYGYGYNNYGQVRRLQARIDRIQRQIERLDRRNILSNREARRLFEESRELERRLARAGRNGLNFRERQNIEVRIARLEMHVRLEATDGNRWGRSGYGYNGYNGQYAYDRDRDGRDDRYEDDQGRRHDGRWSGDHNDQGEDRDD